MSQPFAAGGSDNSADGALGRPGNHRPLGVTYGGRLGQTHGVQPRQILGGRYRLETVLGVGGMSVVWQATDQVLRRSVAVKILAGDYALDVARTTVLSEAQAVARLSHPNICSVFDYGESLQPDGHRVPYIVMELLTGPSVADRLNEGPLPAPEALKIAREVAAGLAEAHANEVVHRDVKPANVILTTTGAKVIDFGIAATVGSADYAGDGHIVATPAYVAPERLAGASVLPPSDMFGWGVLLFRMLTGNLPWPKWIPIEERLDTFEPLPAIPGVPGRIGDLYLSCLAADPGDRPTASTAEAVVQAALAVGSPRPGASVRPSASDELETQSVSLRASGDAERRWRRRRALVLVACLLAVLAATVFAFNKFRGGDSAAVAAPRPTTSAAPGGVFGTEPPGGPSVATTQLPGAVPGPAVPNREVVVRGVPGPVVTVVVTSPGNQQTQPPVVGPATSFSTPGGTAVVVCDTLGPRVTSVEAAPGYYPNQLSLVVVAYVFFTKPADAATPGLTYRLTLKCAASGAEPTATVASYVGDQMLTPSPTS